MAARIVCALLLLTTAVHGHDRVFSNLLLSENSVDHGAVALENPLNHWSWLKGLLSIINGTFMSTILGLTGHGTERALKTTGTSLASTEMPLRVLPVGFKTLKGSLNFNENFTVYFGRENVRVLSDGWVAQISLNQASGSGFRSNSEYLFGKFSTHIMLAPGYTAGTVTSYYMTSISNNHDEVDFEFLGNVTGQPYILQTNVFANGTGDREERIFLWFDPTADFHSYSVLWNPSLIVFFVDDVVIRVYHNVEGTVGIPYLNRQNMGIWSSIWDGSSWATQGGRIPINYTYAPFVALYMNFNIDACQPKETACSDSKAWWNGDSYKTLTQEQWNELRKVQNERLIYHYCTDSNRFTVQPPECKFNTPPEVKLVYTQ